MLRRLMLAQAMQGGGSEDNRPPESTSFGFPLYLNTELYEINEQWAYRERDPDKDSIVADFREWLDNNLEGDVLGEEVPLIGTYGYEVFIDGNEVESCYYDVGTYYMPFKNAPIKYDGWQAFEAMVTVLDTLGVDLYK